jgi:hypothetical protein
VSIIAPGHPLNWRIWLTPLWIPSATSDERCGARPWYTTNYPMMTADRALARLDDLGLDDDTRAHFRAGNATRVPRP